MKRMPQEGTVRIGVAASIPDILTSLGTNPQAVFEEAEIDIELFGDADNIISYAARGHLIKVCVDMTGCEHFGLLLGQRGNLSSFGLIGFLAQQSKSVGSALDSLQRYFHLHAQGARIRTSVEGKLARLSYHIYEPLVEATMQIEDGAMAWALNILRELCGKQFKLAAVCFMHRAPSDRRPYDRLFQAPLSFDSEQEGLYFNADLLDKPLKQADSQLHRLLQKEVDRVQATYHDDFLNHFQRVLHSVLWVRPASADELATLFSMSSRTLHRRLHALGTSYREVADKVKCQIACQVLADSEMQMTDLAELLHYHDASSFIKAFRRWTGVTPTQWRIQVYSKPVEKIPAGSE